MEETNALDIIIACIVVFVALIGLIMVLIKAAKKVEPEDDECGPVGCTHCPSITTCTHAAALEHRRKRKDPSENS
ncbi:MAG: hypothetical protein U5N86_13060 [Planctomycetota bacterium]|nr:hypothetical protein [Planctomycetota bacterium]